MALKLRRGLEADRTDITPAEGEIIYTTDQKQLFVGDGETAGGTLVSSAVVSVNGLQGVVTLTTDDIDEGTNKYFTNTQARNAISATGSGGSYNPTTGVITLSGGGGGATYGISAETGTGGVNLRLTGSDSTTDDVKLAQGSNITLTRTDANTITIASTASSSVQNLNDLIDVEAASPSNGQALVWNNGSTSWQPATIGSGVVSSGVTNQLAYYTDTFTVAGSTKFSINTSSGDLFIEGSINAPAALYQSDSSLANIIVVKAHNDERDKTFELKRSRGTQTVPTAVQLNDRLFEILSNGFDGVAMQPASAIWNRVTGIIPSVTGLEATLSTGTAVVTLTAGDTTGLVIGQYLVKISGIGEFGTYYSGTSSFIVSIDSLTQVTMSDDHAVSGSIVFDSNSFLTTQVAFSNTVTDGHTRAYLKIEDDGQVNIGPDISDFDGPTFTGKMNITSMVSGEHDYAKAMLRLTSTGGTTQGQEIAFTRARGSVDLSGPGGFTLSAVLAGDELCSLAFYGWYEPNMVAGNWESSRIVAEVTGTPTATAVPGKLKLQTADASGTMQDSLTIDHQQMTTFGGMAMLVSYADETAAEAAVDNTPLDGMMYYDTGANAAKMYGNSSWHLLW